MVLMDQLRTTSDNQNVTSVMTRRRWRGTDSQQLTESSWLPPLGRVVKNGFGEIIGPKEIGVITDAGGRRYVSSGVFVAKCVN